MRKIMVVLVACCLQVISVLCAQTYEAMAVEFTPYGGNAMFSESGVIRFAIPLVRKGNSRLFVSPEYKFFNTRPADDIPADYYDRFGFRFAWQYRKNEDWKFQWMAMPSFGSFSGENNDLLFNTVFRVNYRLSDLTCMLGIAYSYRYRNSIVTPVAGIIWKPVNQWTFSAGVPLNLRATYHAKPSWDLGLELSGGGISSLTESASHDFIWVHERNLFLSSDLKLYKTWWLSCSAGYAFSRTLKTYELPEKQVWTLKGNIGEPGLTPVDVYSETGFVARVGLKFKIGRE